MLAARTCRTVFAVVLAMFAAEVALAQTVVMIPASKDNTLYQNSNGSISNGIGSFFFAGKNGGNEIRRGLIAFEVANSVPAGATIVSAQLTLHLSRTSTGDKIVELHKVLAEWGEGTSNAGGEEGSGTAATANDATWLHRLFNTALWTNVGGDFVLASSAGQTVGNIAFYTWGSTGQMVADVQDWLDHPENNFGWALIGDESTVMTSKRFDSKNNSIINNRPVLTVSYTPVTSVKGDNRSGPHNFRLAQNYPNPFNPETTIEFEIPQAMSVQLEVYNALGQHTTTLVDEVKSPGVYRVTWNGQDELKRTLAGGLYFLRLQVAQRILVRKMLLLK